MAKNEEGVVETNDIKYDKETIVKSKKYRDRKDLLMVLLEDEVLYSEEEIKNIIEEFMKGVIE